MPRVLRATRYVQPLREGGSLPAVIDTDAGMFVVKFRGAGQGPKALIAELIVASLADRLGLPTPEIALIDVADAFGRSEPDPEIQDLLRASHGLNVGLRYLDGALNFALAAASDLVTPEFATRLVWLDAFTTNPDRTHRNSNLLVWQGRPWLIDHGAALYAHHDWSRVDDARTRAPFPLIREHVLLLSIGDIDAVDAECAELLGGSAIRDAVDTVPDELLVQDHPESDPASLRDRYTAYLARRLEAPRAFVDAIREAHALRLAEPTRHTSARR